MKSIIALPLVLLMSATAPAAMAEPERKTELLDAGTPVDDIQLRHDFNGVWVIDTQNVMWRDTALNHYLVTLSSACNQLAVRRPFAFHPADSTRLLSSRTYDVRPMAGERCDVAKIERVDEARGAALRKSALRRAW